MSAFKCGQAMLGRAIQDESVTVTATIQELADGSLYRWVREALLTRFEPGVKPCIVIVLGGGDE